MAYNKAKAERQWLRWKEAEEKELRKLGVDEDTIQRLHTYDWAQFNKERQYLQRQVEWSPFVDLISAQDIELPVEDTQALLDSIENTKHRRYGSFFFAAKHGQTHPRNHLHEDERIQQQGNLRANRPFGQRHRSENFQTQEKAKKSFISRKIPAFFLGYRMNGEKDVHL